MPTSADQPKDQNTKKIEDLPPKTVSREQEDKAKGGRAQRSGPGTQTEDEVYIG